MEIIAGHPARKVEERFGQERLLVDEPRQLPDPDRARKSAPLRDGVAGDAPGPEGHDHARERLHAAAQRLGNPVREELVDWKRNGDVDERGGFLRGSHT